MDSLRFSRFLEERRQSGRDLCFVIGGPFGLELERVDHRLSLGAITLPHQLARVVLLEQLYRGTRSSPASPTTTELADRDRAPITRVCEQRRVRDASSACSIGALGILLVALSC